MTLADHIVFYTLALVLALGVIAVLRWPREMREYDEYMSKRAELDRLHQLEVAAMRERARMPASKRTNRRKGRANLRLVK